MTFLTFWHFLYKRRSQSWHKVASDGAALPQLRKPAEPEKFLFLGGLADTPAQTWRRKRGVRMLLRPIKVIALICGLALVLAGCGRSAGSFGSLAGGLFGGESSPNIAASEDDLPVNATSGTPPPVVSVSTAQPARRGLFGRRAIDPNSEIQVNKYLWNAALEVLSFLPLQSADPFTGVIVTGFGTPPGGGRAYRATILIRDPALEARSLSIALVTRSGPAGAATIRAVEDAILARARQLRVGDSGL